MQALGKYEILKEIGSGAMGVVYLARDTRIKRQVALKIMNQGLRRDPEFQQRFEREAEAAGRLQHPNIVTIYDFGEIEGCPFIAMEFLEGRSLEEILLSGETVSLPSKLSWMAQTCRGLEHAHMQGVVHRDIKPANIRVSPDGRVKIVDFGLARLAGSRLTGTGKVFGSPCYMSPEQARNSKDVDGRADQFSAAGILFELLTGRPPFCGDNIPAILLQIVNEPHPRLEDLWPQATFGLPEIVDRALAKKPEDRYPSCGEMALRLEQALGRLQAAEIASQLREVRRLAGFGDMPAARRRCEEILRLDPSNREAQEILDQLQQQGATQAFDVASLRPPGSGQEPAGENPHQKASRESQPPKPARIILTKAQDDPSSNPLRYLAALLVLCFAIYGLYSILAPKTAVIQTPSKQAPTTPTTSVADTSLAVSTSTLRETSLTSGQTVPNLKTPSPATAVLPPGTAGKPLAVPTTTLAAGLAVPEAGTQWMDPNLGIAFQWIPPGTFLMGCSSGDGECYPQESPQHRVTITKGFWLAQNEVTQGQWRSLMGDNPSRNKGEALPVEQVSWQDVQRFLDRLNGAAGKATYRLPTEAEWEYAARSGSDASRYGALSLIAWYDENSDAKTHPVGQKRPNRWGLFDTLGNVWEWCQDRYGENSYAQSSQVDPQGPRFGTFRVVRGGSWSSSAGRMRSSHRYGYDPAFKDLSLGFRLLRIQP